MKYAAIKDGIVINIVECDFSKVTDEVRELFALPSAEQDAHLDAIADDRGVEAADDVRAGLAQLFDPGEGVTLFQSDDAGIGWTYDGETLSSP